MCTIQTHDHTFISEKHLKILMKQLEKAKVISRIAVKRVYFFRINLNVSEIKFLTYKYIIKNITKGLNGSLEPISSNLRKRIYHRIRPSVAEW